MDGVNFIGCQYQYMIFTVKYVKKYANSRNYDIGIVHYHNENLGMHHPNHAGVSY